MKTTRRDFLAACGALAVIGAAAPQSFVVRPSKMKLGTVTYNIAKDWDIETIIKNCEEAKFEGVELRTTHAHQVEANLTSAEREKARTGTSISRLQARTCVWLIS